MKLTLCGTAGGPFTAERASSGYVLQSDGHTIMLECGPGSLRNALAAGIALRDVEAIILSHLHEDHCFDLGAFALQAMYGRFERLPVIYGPPGAGEVATQLMTLHRSGSTLPPPEVVEIEAGDEREICGFVVRSEETQHVDYLHAFSRSFGSKGKTMVFSGDTAPNPDLMCDLAKDADLLLHEAHSRGALERYAAQGTKERQERLLARLPSVHSGLREVARLAQDAGVKRLVLTHLLPTEDDAEMAKEAASIYKGDVVVARDGMTFDI